MNILKGHSQVTSMPVQTRMPSFHEGILKLADNNVTSVQSVGRWFQRNGAAVWKLHGPQHVLCEKLNVFSVAGCDLSNVAEKQQVIVTFCLSTGNTES